MSFGSTTTKNYLAGHNDFKKKSVFLGIIQFLVDFIFKNEYHFFSLLFEINFPLNLNCLSFYVMYRNIKNFEF